MSAHRSGVPTGCTLLDQPTDLQVAVPFTASTAGAAEGAGAGATR